MNKSPIENSKQGELEILEGRRFSNLEISSKSTQETSIRVAKSKSKSQPQEEKTPEDSVAIRPRRSLRSSKIIGIEIFSDIICPWCFIGKRLLQKALEQVDPSVTVKVRWTPYSLIAGLPKDSVDKTTFLTQKYGEETYKRTNLSLTAVQDLFDIKFNFSGKIGHTAQAHRLVEYAKYFDLQNELMEELFREFFERGSDIADFKTLCRIANTVGIPRPRVFLASNALYEEVFTRLDNKSLPGVPFYVINNKYRICGAQPPRQFLSVFEQLGVKLNRDDEIARIFDGVKEN